MINKSRAINTLRRLTLVTLITFGLVSILASGGGGDSPTPPPPTTSPPAAPALSVDFRTKILQFSWVAAPGPAIHFYRLFENPDGVSGFTQVGADLSWSTRTKAIGIAVHRHNWANARYLVEACNNIGCTASNEVTTLAGMLQTIGYVKATNTDANDVFGASLALRDDGVTMAVGAVVEASAATDAFDADQADNSAPGAGAMYAFTGVGTFYHKAFNTEANDFFGTSLAVGQELFHTGRATAYAVGASGEDSAATGINGNQADNSAPGAGAVYVLETQKTYIKASNTEANDSFGTSLAFSDDGTTLAVGAIGEDSAATGINGSQGDNAAVDAGAVYVFTTNGHWSQQAYIKASNTEGNDSFGTAVALSADGNTLAVGADAEASAATGINGNQADNSAPGAGAVYIFTRSGTTWTQQAYIKASNTEANDSFGTALALSADGNTLAVGADGEDSAATGIGGNEGDNSAFSAGAAYVFTRVGTTWTQQAYIKASNAEGNDSFGTAVALSADGSTLAVGADAEASAATGINGDQADNSAFLSGAVYVYTNSGATWSQQAYVKASNTETADLFGHTVVLSGDGNKLAVGAIFEASAATSLGGDQTDNSAPLAGAVYLY